MWRKKQVVDMLERDEIDRVSNLRQEKLQAWKELEEEIERSMITCNLNMIKHDY